MSTIAVLAATRTLLQAVSGVSQVDVTLGAQLPWTKRAKPRQSYWMLHYQAERMSEPLIGGFDAPAPVLQVEGWMPWSFASPDTAPAWDDLVDAVANKLRDNRSLSLTVSDARLPQLLVNDLVEKSDEHTDARLCHHCVFTVEIADHESYVGS